MTVFGFRSVSSGFLFTFAGLVLLSIAGAAIKHAVARRRLRRAVHTSRADSLVDHLAAIPLNSTSTGSDTNLFGMRALEAGFHGGVVQAEAIPRQSSIMRDRHISRLSSSTRRSDDESMIDPARRKSVFWPRSMPHDSGISYTRELSGTLIPNRRASLISERPSSAELSLSATDGPRYRSQGSNMFDRSGHRSMSFNTDKPFPPLPRRPERSRFSLPMPSRFSTQDPGERKRKLTKSLPSPSPMSPSPMRTKARRSRPPMPCPSKWKQLPHTPSLTHLDGSVESTSSPHTTRNRLHKPPFTHGRARTQADLPFLPSHPIAEFAKRKTIDDLYDDYFDLQFAGYIIPSQASMEPGLQYVDTSPFNCSYVPNETARHSIPTATMIVAHAHRSGRSLVR